MAITQPRKMSLIPEINRDTQDWTVTVQVVERHRPKVGTGTPNKPGKRYRRYMLVDEEGNKVSGIVYESDIRFFEYSLLPFKRYNVSNAYVIPAVSFFKLGPYPFSWVLDYKKLVEPVHEEVPPTLPFKYDLMEFAELSKHADAEFYFDIKGIVIHAFPRKQVTPTSTHREVVIIDERKVPIILTLWNEFGDEEGLKLANAFPATSIIIARNVKATTFHGLSLSTRMYSYILINPPLPDSLALQGWCHDNNTEIKKMVKAHTFRDPSVLFPPPALEDTITVQQAIATLQWRKTAWVVGKPKFTPGKHKYYFNACQTCKRTLDCPMEWVIECSNCGEKSGVEYRSRIPIRLTEGDDTLFVTIKSPDVELLTNVTPQHLKDSHEFDLNVEEEVKEALEKLTIVCFLRKKQKKKKEDDSQEFVSYSSVKAYNVASLEKNVHLDSPLKVAAAEPDAQKEDQFFTPTTSKVLAEIEQEQATTKNVRDNTSVKRTIDFIAAAAPLHSDKEDQTSTFNASGHAEPSPVDATSAESPVKKAKEKQS